MTRLHYDWALIWLLGPFLLAVSSSSSMITFDMIHREAEKSPIKTTHHLNLPKEIYTAPLKDFLISGIAMSHRLSTISRVYSNGNSRLPVISADMAEFYVTIPVGSQPQNLTFLVDTGSELIWHQCRPKPTINCNRPDAADIDECYYTDKVLGVASPFNTSDSASYTGIPCLSPGLCYNSPGVSLTPTCNDTCSFEVGYGDGTVESGHLALETFHTGGSVEKQQQRLVFGCTKFTPSASFLADMGIMGMSPGPFSFISQILANDNSMPQRFAYCLPESFQSLNYTGSIHFGNYVIPPSSLISAMSYTPLQPPFGPSAYMYYYVTLEGITIGSVSLDTSLQPVNTSDLITPQGTIFDTGTPLTHLQTPLYNRFLQEFISQSSHLNPSTADGTQACYTMPVSETKLPSVPTVSFHFANNMTMELGPEDLLFAAYADSVNSTVCLAMRDADSSTLLNIIGNYQQRNYWVEVDHASRRLGIAKANCARSI